MPSSYLCFTRWASIALLGLLTLSPAGANAGMSPEEVKAFETCKVSALKGEPEGLYDVGLCYSSGDGVVKDDIEAVRWFRKAVEQGYWRAHWALGDCYLEGVGVPKDTIEGYAHWNLGGIKSPFARVRLANLEKMMSREEIAAGQRRARELQKEIEAALAADSKLTTTPAAEQPKLVGPLLWVILFLLLLVLIVVGGILAVLAFKKAASIARAKASGNSYDDSKPTHGFFYYWALSSLAILTFLSALGYLNGGASGFYYQLGRGLIMAPIAGLVVGGIWNMLSK